MATVNHVRRGIVLKIAIVGDKGSGKWSIVKKYVEGRRFTTIIDDKSQPYGCVERDITLKSVDVTLSIWYLKMRNIDDQSVNTQLSILLNDAKIVLFTFDLTSMESLLSIKKWYKTSREFNKVEFYSDSV